LRHYRPSLPFHAYSSRNKRQCQGVRSVMQRRSQALDMWAKMMTMRAIAEILGVDIDTVKGYIKSGRQDGDPRVNRAVPDQMKLKANVRRMEIARLSSAGYSVSEIAERLKCNPRLVQIRLKENATTNPQDFPVVPMPSLHVQERPAVIDKISVTINEATKLTGISRTLLYRLFNEGKLTPRKLGNRTLILVDDLDSLVKSLPSGRD